MEIKKGTLVRCKRSHQFLKVEDFRPATTVKYLGKDEHRPASVWVKSGPKDLGVLRKLDEVVVLA